MKLLRARVNRFSLYHLPAFKRSCTRKHNGNWEKALINSIFLFVPRSILTVFKLETVFLIYFEVTEPNFWFKHDQR